MKKNIIIIILCFINITVKPQALPIYIDGTFGDWENAIFSHEDDPDDGEEIDFLKFTVANDNDFLFIKIEFSEETDLSDNNNIYLNIDTDNNSSTGYMVNGIGSEMSWNFGQKYGYFNLNSSYEYIYHANIQLRILPTVTSNIFEIAIGRDAKPNGINNLFTGDTINLCFTDSETNGDNIPNEGAFFTYVFDNTDVPPVEPILIQKEDSSLLRLMTYNIQNDFENEIGGLDDPERIPGLERIFKAVSPEIITINECWNTTVSTAQNFLNTNLPLENGYGWYANKIDGSNITASSYPIVQSWLVHPNRKITANLIDLPEKYKDDILVINAHFKCCDDDETRQLEADAFASFILDAKTPGGRIDLPENIPFVLMGDLNLVGLSQQLKTLIEGDIQDSVNFGLPASLDWDNSNLEDLISCQTDKRMAYTWRNDYSSYLPGRLDFMIFSNSVMGANKAFTLQTEVMSEERLQIYGLQLMDTRNSSDHFPKVTDFELPLSVEVGDITIPTKTLEIYPNPAKNLITIESSIRLSKVIIRDTIGEVLKSLSVEKEMINIDISELTQEFISSQFSIKMIIFIIRKL